MTYAELILAERKANARLLQVVRQLGAIKGVTLAAAEAAFWSWRDLARRLERKQGGHDRHKFEEAHDDPAPAPNCWNCGKRREDDVHL